MPKVSINYQNTIIYKIVCKNLEIKDCYVGNTTDFIRRKQEHKSACNNLNNHKKHDLKIYNFINKNGGWNNFVMLEIEKFPCSDGNEARARERYHLEQLNANLNCVVPARTKKEYRINNVEEIKLYKQQYRELNREQISLYNKQYRENNTEQIKFKYDCDCGGRYTHQNISLHLKTKKHLAYLAEK